MKDIHKIKFLVLSHFQTFFFSRQFFGELFFVKGSNFVSTTVVAMKPGCTVYINPQQKEEIVIDGIDVEYVSQCAALINQCVRVGKKDVRKFMDGIYISERTFQAAENA